MLKACQYCGKVHDKKYVCKAKAKILKERDGEQFKRNLQNRKFRSSINWRKKANAIRLRDNNLCVVCLSKGIYNPAEGVHHIVSLSENFDKRLDDDNLISLCNDCHERAEQGKISKTELLKLIPPTI